MADLWEKLYDKYPFWFKQVGGDPRESCLCWGIECNYGWYDLISALLYRIKQHEDNMAGKEYAPVKLVQIKEKFGGLRFYYDGGDEYVDGAVSMAEEMSYKICERCGSPGRPNKGGWVVTLCTRCEKLNGG